MKLISGFHLLALVFATSFSHAQTATLQYELNGRTAADLAQNPFAAFVGDWTLKNDDWTHNWGGDTESIKIPGHHTVTRALNTNHSLLSIVDGPAPNGHIFWSLNPKTGVVEHLSSFGESRAGSGSGTVDERGDVRLRLSFADEAEGTYRLYHYRWISADEYHMKSVQYDAAGVPTGLFYEGTFVRVAVIRG